jgi:hypothetical protein
MVAQSDWLPMMIATGFPVICPLNARDERLRLLQAIDGN